MSTSATTADLTLDAQTRALPTGERRDEHGRRIALTFVSTLVRPIAPPADCWCVAIDGSRHSMQALAQAMQLPTKSGVCTLDIGTVHQWLSIEAAETELARCGLAASADARALLDARGLSAVEGLLLGSVAQQIINNAPGAVLVVRAPAAPEEKVAC